MRTDVQTNESLEKVRALEAILNTVPQTFIPVEETLHDGVYTRSCVIPAGVTFTGCLIKVPTTLLIFGDCSLVLPSGEVVRVRRFLSIEAAAGRKAAFTTHSEVHMTMVYRTEATSFEEVHQQLTDELLQTDREEFRV